MSQYSQPIAFTLDYASALEQERVDSADESRAPSFLGFLTAVYFVTVVTMSTASASTSWVPQATGALLGACWVVVGLFVKGNGFIWAKPVALYATFTLWCFSGIAVTIEQEYFLTMFFTTAKIMVVTVVAHQCVRTRSDYLICCLMLGMTSVFMLYQGLDTITRAMQFSGKEVTLGSRAEGLLISNANDMAEFSIVVGIGAMACFVGFKNVLLKAIATLPIGAALYMVAASGSRMGMVGVFISAFGVYWFHFRREGKGAIMKRIMVVFLATSMIGGATYFIINSPFFFRLAKVASSSDAAQDEPRFQWFLAALGATAGSPILGLGLGGFALNRLGTTKTGEMCISHSTISETLSCTGIPGFLLYFGARLALLQLIRKTRRLPLSKWDSGVTDMLMPLFCVLCLFDVVSMTYNHRLEWPIIGAACGYMLNLHRMHKERTDLVAV